MAKHTHRVTHPSLYLQVKGKLQEIAVGTLVEKELGEKLAARGWAASIEEDAVLEDAAAAEKAAGATPPPPPPGKK